MARYCRYTMYSDTWVQNIQDTPVARDSMGTQCTQIHRYKTLTTLQWLGSLIVHYLLKHMHMNDTAAAKGSMGTLCTQTHRCKRSTTLQWLGTLWVHCVLCGYTVYSDTQVQNIDNTPVARDAVYNVYSNRGIQNTSMKH